MVNVGKGSTGQKQLAAIIFDVDGTLADTERDGHRVAFNAAFKAEGLSWHWDEVLYGELIRTAGGKERMREYAQKHAPDISLRPDFDELIQRLHRHKTERYVEQARSGGIALRPGVLSLIQEARAAGVRLAIATTTTMDNITSLLSFQMAEYATPDGQFGFEVIAAGDIVAAKKPAPDIYHYTLHQLQLPATSCLAIEDSNNGLRSALGAGIPTVVTMNTYTQNEDFSGALQVLNSLAETNLSKLIDLWRSAIDH